MEWNIQCCHLMVQDLLMMGHISAKTDPGDIKNALISVIIHEVGHNWFPMIINTDERSWTWMDEGLNTYVQMITERTWEDEYPSRRGEPQQITTYMKGTNEVPIMTDADSLRQKGSNAYAKPATAMNILRETSVIGAENFDFAFKQYAQTWAFKAPPTQQIFSEYGRCIWKRFGLVLESLVL